MREKESIAQDEIVERDPSNGIIRLIDGREVAARDVAIHPAMREVVITPVPYACSEAPIIMHIAVPTRNNPA